MSDPKDDVRPLVQMMGLIFELQIPSELSIISQNFFIKKYRMPANYYELPQPLMTIKANSHAVLKCTHVAGASHTAITKALEPHIAQGSTPWCIHGRYQFVTINEKLKQVNREATVKNLV